MRTSLAPHRALAAGFTLIELLGVLIIISILAFFLVTRLADSEDVVKRKLAREEIEFVGAALGEYEIEKGDYPPSTALGEWGAAPNATNLGIEALYVSLWQKGIDGAGVKEDKLVNVDQDAAVKRLTVNPALDLFELADPWGNPLAYFHHRDYDRRDLYTTEDPATGEVIDGEVGARKSSKTGAYFNPHEFQLISAGPDGQFGTDDDVGNFNP